MSSESKAIAEWKTMAERTITPNSPVTLKLVTVIAAIAGIVTMVWQASAFKTEVTTELRNAVAAIESMRTTLQKNGTDVQQLGNRISSLELLGSQPLRDAVQKIEKSQDETKKRLEAIDTQMRIHVLKSEPLTFPPSGGKANGDAW